MIIIKIARLQNGGHENQFINQPITVPEGWAVVPEDVGTMETLENFPFGEITVEDVDGVPTVTSWSPLPLPAPPEQQEPPVSLEERVDVLETNTAAISAAVRKGFCL